MSETEQGPQPEQNLVQTLAAADRILSGNVGDKDFPEDSFDPAEVLAMPVLDLNDETLTDQDRAYAAVWIERKLGSPIEQAPVKKRLKSPDGKTTVAIFGVTLGSGNDRYYLSSWENEGEKPSYILWQEEMYDEQEELGYEDITGAPPQTP